MQLRPARLAISLLALTLFAAFAARATAANTYTLTDLGTLGGGYSAAFGINEAGQVVGGAQPAVGNVSAFLWDPSTTQMRDLGTPAGALGSQAAGINETGQVVGAVYLAGGWTRAFLWDSEHGMQDLGTLPGNDYAQATGINDLGQVVGFSTKADAVYGDVQHAFLWDSEHGMQDLGTLGGTTSRAFGINDLGQVVGTAQTADGRESAFLWDPSTREMRDLGTLPGGWDSQATGINEAGQIIGVSNTTVPEYAPWHAFIWQNGAMTDLGTLGGSVSWPSGINNAGQVTGQAYIPGNLQHAFLWDNSNGMQDLGTLGGEISVAYGINDVGEVVGSAWTANQFIGAHAFIARYQNTRRGTNVPVQPTSTVSLTFSSVTGAGNTTVTPTTADATPLPANFQLSGAQFYEIHTTATFAGTVRLTMSYDPARFPDQQNIRLLHFEDGAWRDITTSVDLVNHVVLGETTSFSPFAIARRGYSWSGVLQPINADGSSIFKQGSTVPVTFTIAGVASATARLFVAKVTEGVVGSELEPSSTSAADSGNTFRCDGPGKYIYNLGTKPLSQGSYQLRIDLGDGAAAGKANGRLVMISLRK